MAGSLIKIDEEIVTTAVASVTLTGIDSTYDVYMVKINNMIPSTDYLLGAFRFTESGTPNTTSNYDRAAKVLKGNAVFQNAGYANESQGFITDDRNGTAGNESTQLIMYIFNANNSSEYTFCTMESTSRNASGDLIGRQGGNVLTVTSEVDGVQFYYVSGNIDTGSKFTLYGLKK